MFWYTNLLKINKTAAVGISCLTAVMLSCTSASVENQHNTDPEFDIPTFFKNEIMLLDSTAPKVTKTVLKDSISETKELVVADWQKELASFSAVDLNKPAYQHAYSKDSSANSVTYTFRDPSADLSLVRIDYEAGAPVAFTIKRQSKNLLYNTEEKLEYVKGKSYSIDKVQTVKLLGSQHYHIKGLIE